MKPVAAKTNLELLVFSGYHDRGFSEPISNCTYQVMINPEAIVHQQKQIVTTQSGNQTTTKLDELSFRLVIDCTGIVDPKRTDMASEIAGINKVFAGVQNSNYIKIQWGAHTTFKTKLKSIDTSYTFFKPDGSPLRAKIDLVFGEVAVPKIGAVTRFFDSFLK